MCIRDRVRTDGTVQDRLVEDSEPSLDERRRPDFGLYPESTDTTMTVPDHLYHVRCANLRSNLAADAFLEDTNSTADLHYSHEAAKYARAEADKIILL